MNTSTPNPNDPSRAPSTKPAQRPRVQRQGAKAESIQPPTEPKSLLAAFGYNIFIIGGGYFYLGKPVIGVLVFILVALNAGIPLVYVVQNPRARDSGAVLGFAIGSLIFWHVLCAIDLALRIRKLQRVAEVTDTKTCPRCAETIKAAAVVCRHCGADLGASNALPSVAPSTAVVASDARNHDEPPPL